MFFDDRLATVLRQNTQSDVLRRTQFRQLLDLLGAQTRGARNAVRDPSLVAAAWMRMSKLADLIPSHDRARLIKEPGWRLRNPELTAHLADFEPEVASAALSRAQLSSDDWTALIPRLPIRARGFLRLRKDLGSDVEAVLERLGVHDRGLPSPDARPADVPVSEPVSFGAEDGATNLDDVAAQGREPIDALPGSNIAPEDLPPPDLVGTPLKPLSGGASENSHSSKEGGASEEGDDIPAQVRPIFFPKARSDPGETRPKATPLEPITPEPFNPEPFTPETFTPQPFTKEELWEIAEEPLGKARPDKQGPDDQSSANEADDVFDLNEEADARDQQARDQQARDQGPLPSSTAPSDPPRPQNMPGVVQTEGRSEISALVDRIAQFKRTREEASEAAKDEAVPREEGNALMPRLPLGEEDTARNRLVRGFAFAADAAGRIEWAESEVAPMVVGTRMIARSRLQTRAPQSQNNADALTLAFNQRQVIKAAPLTLSGASMIAGDWLVDAQPRFSAIGGFSGYIGRMRRRLEVAADPQPSPAAREADRIRQLLHELRTPVTAVQGYSEVIQQQLFGSAPHEYRALAAAIASDAARILSGFEELDRLAKLETGAIDVEEGASDITALTKRIIRQLAQVLDTRMSGVELTQESEAQLVANIEDASAESLMWRMLATLGGGCAAGETLKATLSHTQHASGAMIQLACELPAQLLGEADLFAADARPLSAAISPGLFGAGFALRLARAEARAGGGDLRHEDGVLILTLPQIQNSQNKILSGELATKDPN